MAARGRKKRTKINFIQTEKGGLQEIKLRKTKHSLMCAGMHVGSYTYMHAHTRTHSLTHTHTVRGTVNKSASSWGSKTTNPVEIRIKP